MKKKEVKYKEAKSPPPPNKKHTTDCKDLYRAIRTDTSPREPLNMRV